MSPDQIVSQAKSKFAQAIEHFKDDLNKIRTGRAHPSMLEGVVVEAYGTPMPLLQVASVSTPEPQLLQISPFDPSNIQAVVTAIRNNPSLDMNPSDDGRVVRVPIPPLNEERRREYVKMAGAKTEECMVSLRNIRHDAMKSIDQAKKDKTVGEDEAVRLQKQLDDAMTEVRSDAESAQKTKEQEIMTV